ncbi:copper-binding transcription factor [Entomophthora muscae]|uniref:Copper-binding transcription factor n=1 Tax=Entomophthora muscae TaxID=34485 RepID=A0ACC2U708_9FUNG|nr:copper-binding transcription factor [Entomophthora muscae]
MVIKNGEKYSCASCIKGHRSTSCQHINRPLIPVKRKGRPITQCAHCRELRKTKKLHIKCICAEKAIKANSKISCGSSGHASSSSKVQNLLNPCDCSKGSHCQCCELSCESPSTRFCRPKPAPAVDASRLEFELPLPEPPKSKDRPILPSPVLEEKGSFCACGCRSTFSGLISAPLGLKDLLNPCNCCMDGKKCGCNHLKKSFDDSKLFSGQTWLESTPAAACCSNTPISTQSLTKEHPITAPSCCSNPPVQEVTQIDFLTLTSWYEGQVILDQTDSCCSSAFIPPFPEILPSVPMPEKSCCQSAYGTSATNQNGLLNLPLNQQQSNCCSSTANTCSSCAGGCKCRQRPPSSNSSTHLPTRHEYIDQDGIRNCGCGCYLSSMECTDCIQDVCTGKLTAWDGFIDHPF